MRITVLGCGGSQGVPSATGDWGSCDPADPRNYRRRPAVLVETETPDGEPRRLLIDAPPELRDQLIRAGTRRIDAVLLTHSHADHVHGLDDLKAFAWVLKRPIPLFAEASVIAEVRQRFAYAFPPQDGPYRPILEAMPITGSFEAARTPVTPFAQDHGFGPSTGFRIGPFAYSIDVVALPEASFAALDGITHWIVDCQQLKAHPTHSHLAQTLEWIRRLKPARAVLTHLGSSLDYETLRTQLPAGVEPGFDGLVLEI